MGKKKAGPKCGARKRQPKGTKEKCTQAAGWGTDHPGEGRCKLHGGASPIKHGRYSTITRKSIRQRMDALAADKNPLDLEPDLLLLRALLVDYIERYDAFTEALFAWHDSYRNNGNSEPKPIQLLDISDASTIIEKVSRVVERVHKIRSESSLSFETFRRLMEQMGLAVAKHVDADTVGRIEAEWGTISVDGNTGD